MKVESELQDLERRAGITGALCACPVVPGEAGPRYVFTDSAPDGREVCARRSNCLPRRMIELPVKLEVWQWM